jgi:lysophospholipase L1-like esterase
MCLMNSSLKRRIVAIIVLAVFAAASCAGAAEPLLKRGQARVALVGDSITGLSRNYATGFAHLMDWALAQTYPGCRPNLVSLGGSGQGVRSWRDVELRSRTQEVLLDVPGIDVQAALSQPADVLIIMLGMNDVLAPYVVDEPAAWDEWKANYRELISALRARFHPQVTALAGATLCTEDLASPKNRILDKLNAQAASLAKELGLLWLPTNETMRDVLQQGRRLQRDFHVTYDYVHPNEPGHIAIAIAMLRGLGEEAAAKTLGGSTPSPGIGEIRWRSAEAVLRGRSGADAGERRSPEFPRSLLVNAGPSPGRSIPASHAGWRPVGRNTCGDRSTGGRIRCFRHAQST